MAYEPKPDSGSLWKNDKDGVDSRPDRKGSALIGGKEYWVSGWLKQHDTRGQWLSLSFQPKGEPKAKPADGKMKPRREDPADGDEIPF